MALADTSFAANQRMDRYRADTSTMMIAGIGLVLTAFLLFFYVDPGVVQEWLGYDQRRDARVAA
ncbi:MAG: hypothetical protein AAF631_12080, partial [Pseudomonadota bacterium]